MTILPTLARQLALLAVLTVVAGSCSVADQVNESVVVETEQVELRANSAEEYCSALADVLNRQAELATFGPDETAQKIEALEAFGASLLEAADAGPLSQADILDGYAVANVRLIAAERSGDGLAAAQGATNQYFFTEMQPVYAHAEQSCELDDMAMPAVDEVPVDDVADGDAGASGDDNGAGLLRAPEPLGLPDPAAPAGTFGCSIGDDFRYVIDITNDSDETSDFQIEAVVFDAEGEQLNTTELIIKALRPGERTVEARPGAPAAGATCEEAAIERFGLTESPVPDDVVGCVLTPAVLGEDTEATLVFLNTTADDASYQYTAAFVGEDGVRRGAGVGTTGLVGPGQIIEAKQPGPPATAGAATCDIVETFRVTPG